MFLKLFLILSTTFTMASAAMALAADPLKLTETSLGPIDSKTKVSLKQFKKLLPTYEIESDKLVSEGEDVGQKFHVFNGSNRILEINVGNEENNYIYSVLILDSKIKTPNGLHVGSKLEELIALKFKLHCVRGTEETENEIHCTKPDSNIGYIFPPSAEEEEKTAAGEVLPVALQAKSRVISGIFWHPPRVIRKE